MKVVLLKDIKHVGRAHTVVDVSDGHALNHLIPQKHAVPATASAVKQAGEKVGKMEEHKVMEVALIKQTLTSLADGVVTVAKKTNDQGHLYDAVTTHTLAELTKLPESAIHLEKPIKELGRFTIPVAYGEEFGSFELEVVGE